MPFEALTGKQLYAFVGNAPVRLVDPLGLKDYGCQDVDRILNDAREDADLPFPYNYLNSLENHGGDGVFDFKSHEPNSTFMVHGEKLAADQFGNFLAGYTGKYLGNSGYVGVRAGGVYYDFQDTRANRKRPDMRDLMGRKQPGGGFDWDADSLPDIRNGANDGGNDRRNGSPGSACYE